jgi:hypothetical protein
VWGDHIPNTQQYTDPLGAVVVLTPVMRRVLVVTRRCGRDPRLCEGDNIGTGWIARSNWGSFESLIRDMVISWWTGRGSLARSHQNG